MRTKYFIFRIALAITVASFGSCKKSELDIVEVSFSADKTTVSAGEEVTFTIGAGADALSIYSGVAGQDFQNSQINLIELKGYTEEQLKKGLYANRLPILKEYNVFIPDFTAIPEDYTFSGTSMEIYEGTLVPWDFSNVTKSKYLKLNLADGEPQTLTMKTGGVVLPQMLGYTNANLTQLGALTTTPNNNFMPFMAFPDGFTPASTTGTTVRIGIQVVIDNIPSAVTYFDATVRELLQSPNFNLTNAINAWRTANPTANPANGMSEINLTFNADNPTVTDDDGALLSYIGNIYIQEVRLGDAGNMIKRFDQGVKVPFVYNGTASTYKFKYTTPGTYTATLVASYIGRKEYSGDGYRTGRADEISASEYPIERRFKTITITVQ